METIGEQKVKTKDKLKNFRRSLVAASGILLGFVLNVAAEWAMKPEKAHDYHSLVTAVCLVICILLLLITILRALKMDYPRERAEQYYQRTLICFTVGVLIIFANIIFLVVQKFFM